MHSALKITKFHIHDSRRSLMVFYAIVIGLSLFAASCITRGGGNSLQIGGIDLASAIFIFIVGLNAFTTGFRFMQANNVSRKRYYTGTALALISIAAFMATIDTILSTFIGTLIHYESMLTQLYRITSPLTLLAWSFALYTCLTHLGWMIGMLYHRSNKLFRMMISVSPVLTGLVITFFDHWVDGALSRGLAGFFTTVFGFTSAPPNPYTATISFLVAATGAAAISFLLIRRVTLKSQG